MAYGPTIRFGGPVWRSSQAIADALGIPISQFYGERDPPPVGDVIELIRLYAAIDDVQGRQRLMTWLAERPHDAKPRGDRRRQRIELVSGLG